MRTTSRAEIPVEAVEVSAYRVPTAYGEESDGTARWNATTLVLVEITGGGETGIGYTYADAATARFIADTLVAPLKHADAAEIGRLGKAMRTAVRNFGGGGLSAMGISVVDNALWDLKAKVYGVSLTALLGCVRDEVPVYGSGGFTSLTIAELREQLAGWAAMGIARMKMKVGRDPGVDLARVRAAREAVGAEAELFVDANGAYDVKQALTFAERFQEYGVSWFEEPVAHRDLAGLRWIRERAPASMEIAIGEYGYEPADFAEMLRSGGADVLQADATRCGGISGLLTVAALCETHDVPLSTHCAPALHAPVAAALSRVRHIEYFSDHARIERMLFDGTPEPNEGLWRVDRELPGLGLTFKRADARRYAI